MTRGVALHAVPLAVLLAVGGAGIAVPVGVLLWMDPGATRIAAFVVAIAIAFGAIYLGGELARRVALRVSGESA